MLEWHGDTLVQRLEEATAAGLLRAALFFREQHRARLSTPSPHHAVRRQRQTAGGPPGSRYQVYDAPSKAGEYLKLRTGHGRDSTTVQPTTAAAVAAAGLTVTIGYALPPGLYMLHWERRGQRKGLLDTLEAVRGPLAVLARAQETA